MKTGYEVQSLCPFCPHGEVVVKDSRITKEGWRIRRRMCMHCAKRWTTYEVDAATLDSLHTVKRSVEAIGIHIANVGQALSRLGLDTDVDMPLPTTRERTSINGKRTE
jgi:transcriptional regulator NrdR family protein